MECPTGAAGERDRTALFAIQSTNDCHLINDYEIKVVPIISVSLMNFIENYFVSRVEICKGET